jgi:hypothetical protein
LLEFRLNGACYQVSADNEENIDADEAAAKRIKASVE